MHQSGRSGQGKASRGSWKDRWPLPLGIGAAATLLSLPVLRQVRLGTPNQPLTDTWQRLPVERRGSTLLGISFRPPQVAALGLEPRATLQFLLGYPLQLIRLGAYWRLIESAPGVFDTRGLDWQVDAAERAGVPIILCVGAVKTFGYPEFFAPPHRLPRPLRERSRVTPGEHASLLAAAADFIGRLVDRYKDRRGIVAWQVEHEAVDPLGMEHSWRLDTTFVAREVDAVRRADPSRPILMNGYLPASLPVRLFQWWQTRDQGDSLAAAERMADIVGLDYYPRHALVSVGARTLYLDGSRDRWPEQKARQLLASTRARGQRLMISEGQAEPWEATTIPANPTGQGLSSCLPEHVVANYNACMRWGRQQDAALYAYLFWGAEYWVLRQRSGDASYARAFGRVLEQA